MGEIKAVLLDVDGTLIDSVREHALAWADVCAEFGYSVDADEVTRMIGMGGDRVLPALTGLDDDSEKGKQITERRAEIFHERYLPNLQPFPRVAELMQKMSDDGYMLVAASSASLEDLDMLLEKAGVADLMDRKTSSDDAESSKPAPDIIEAALKKAGCRADEAVMIGDTPYDVLAALRAGVRSLGLRCSGWDDVAFIGAESVYDSMADLLEHYDESILKPAKQT